MNIVDLFICSFNLYDETFNFHNKINRIFLNLHAIDLNIHQPFNQFPNNGRIFSLIL